MKIINGDLYIDQVEELIYEYTEYLNRDLSFQNLDEELADFAKKYTDPNGRLLVCIENNKVVGMVVYHHYDNSCCEMKRLYVKNKYRGQKIGEKLIRELLKLAKNDGYKEMVLDTIKPLQEAIHLYKKLGFQECDAYYYNPMEDVIYMKKEL